MPEVGAAAQRDSQWARLSDALGEQMGLYYPRERWSDLERGITAAARAFGKSADVCVDWLLSRPLSRQQIEVLASCLTVGETYFFREKRSFDVLRDEILPDLLRQRRNSERRLRIWSAGCCTGEEPYSIAMLLANTIPDMDEWNISILATDIDPNFLRKASAGSYSRWSFRDAPAGMTRRYFHQTQDGAYEISPHIKELVEFTYLNLAEDNYPSVANGTNAMDIVFCRNVLMYFDARNAAKVLQRLGWSLVEGGWLFINPVEIPHTALPQLESVQFGDVIAYRKNSTAHATGQSFRMPFENIAPARETVPTSEPVDVVQPRMPEPASERARDYELASASASMPVVAAAQALRQSAAAAYGEGDYRQTVQLSLQILADAPDDTATKALLARAYANQGRLMQALQCCEQAVAADKLNPEWRRLMATILQELGRLDEAGDALVSALYLDPDQPLAHFSLSTVLRRQGRAADARRHVRNALALLEKHPADEIVPESEGLSARRLAEIIRMTLPSGDDQ